ncbi:MAG: tyrosine-type recombinase/integrase, partial [Anaerolineae bacterium]
MIANHNEAMLGQFEQYLAQIALSPKTVTNYLADLRVFTRWAETTQAPQFSVTGVTADQIRQYRNYLLEEQGRAPSTVNRHLQALRKCCAYMAQTNLAPGNAAEEISLITAEKRCAPGAIKGADIDALLAAANNSRTFIARRDAAILHLLVNAGLRVAEVVGLKTGDVFFDYPGVHLTIRDSRGRGTRDIPLLPGVCGALKEWLLIRPRATVLPHLFLSQEGTPISTRTVQRIVNRCAKTAGVSGVTAQLLRRTYAVRLLKETANLELVRQRL